MTNSSSFAHSALFLIDTDPLHFCVPTLCTRTTGAIYGIIIRAYHRKAAPEDDYDSRIFSASFPPLGEMLYRFNLSPKYFVVPDFSY